jgi:hypothetical protein
MESMKSQSPSTKPGLRPEGGDAEGEITNKSQIPIMNDQNRFGIFISPTLQYSNIPSAERSGALT